MSEIQLFIITEHPDALGTPLDSWETSVAKAQLKSCFCKGKFFNVKGEEDKEHNKSESPIVC